MTTPDEPIYRTVAIDAIEDFLAICETMPQFDITHPEDYAALEIAKAALANRQVWTGERLTPPLTDAEILILRSFRTAPFVAYDEEWPTLDALVSRGLLSVKSGPEVQGRWYEITKDGRDAMQDAWDAKRGTTNA